MIEINPKESNLNGNIQLESSKSISNRMLIIRALSQENFQINNLSQADDTVILDRLLNDYKNLEEIDCHHAGTTLRFLTSFLSIKNGEWTLKGSERMHQRPIAPLVESLKQLGSNINYLEKSGYPPLRIKGQPINGDKIDIRGDISSQYISSLLMIAPIMKNGLNLNIVSDILSKPYIKMTLELMSNMGIEHTWDGASIVIKNQPYIGTSYSIENDWSGASFWYSFAALANSAEINLPFLYESSVQGDSNVRYIYEKLGVSTYFHEKGITIKKSPQLLENPISIDLKNYPDLGLPIAVTCAGLGLQTHLYGLESLKYKESDRLLMIKNELHKFNIESIVDSSSIVIKEGQKLEKPSSIIECHDDHRIPMSIAPLAMKIGKIKFNDKTVVNKSYPRFWNDLERVQISCK